MSHTITSAIAGVKRCQSRPSCKGAKASSAVAQSMPLQSIDSIADYHAHIYFDGEGQRRVAQALRDEIDHRFDIFVSRLVDRPIGPHPVPMFEVAFDPSMFATIVPWLMLNRDGLSVLVHPNTGFAKADHLVNALWLGEQKQLIVGPLE